MDARGGDRAGYIRLEAVDPVSGKLWRVFVSDRRLDAVARRGMLHAMEAAHTVPRVLRWPKAVFEGIRTDQDERGSGEEPGWLCYVATPSCAYHADGGEREPWPDKVFVVFVNADRVAYNWRWEKRDPGDPRLPTGYEKRFRKRLL